MYTIYLLTNVVTGKRYVGCTKHSLCKRFGRNGLGYKNQKHVYADISRCGWQNYEKRILFKTHDRAEAGEAERKYIALYNTTDPERGYNIASGGFDGYCVTEECKRRMSAARTGVKPPPFTKEHRQHMRDSHAGGAEPRAVMCVETGETFKSINDAARAYATQGANKRGISGCCHGAPHYNTCGGFRWRFTDKGA